MVWWLRPGVASTARVKALADFLRVANGRSEDEIRKMTARMVDPDKEDEDKQ